MSHQVHRLAPGSKDWKHLLRLLILLPPFTARSLSTSSRRGLPDAPISPSLPLSHCEYSLAGDMTYCDPPCSPGDMSPHASSASPPPPPSSSSSPPPPPHPASPQHLPISSPTNRKHRYTNPFASRVPPALALIDRRLAILNAPSTADNSPSASASASSSDHPSRIKALLCFAVFPPPFPHRPFPSLPAAVSFSPSPPRRASSPSLVSPAPRRHRRRPSRDRARRPTATIQRRIDPRGITRRRHRRHHRSRVDVVILDIIIIAFPRRFARHRHPRTRARTHARANDARTVPSFLGAFAFASPRRALASSSSFIHPSF